MTCHTLPQGAGGPYMAVSVTFTLITLCVPQVLSPAQMMQAEVEVAT